MSTTQQKAGAQISTKAFVQSLVILLVLMIVAGVLTRVVPAGRYARTVQEGRELIDPQSFQRVARPDYPVWRWFTAPVEVLWGPDGLTVITIVVFILLVRVRIIRAVVVLIRYAIAIYIGQTPDALVKTLIR